MDYSWGYGDIVLVAPPILPHLFFRLGYPQQGSTLHKEDRNNI